MNNQPAILLVDDDEFAAAVTAEVLAAEYKVQHITNGAEALQAVLNEQPALVLLDIDMPGMSGYEVCRTLRDEYALGDLPIIFLSGMVSDDDRLAGYEAGGDDYLTKPVSAEQLRAKIRVALASYEERRRLQAGLSNAFSTAMTAMSSSAEIGAVLQFMRASFNCPDYASLCREVLNTMSSYGLEASVKIHGQQGMVAISTG